MRGFFILWGTFAFLAFAPLAHGAYCSDYFYNIANQEQMFRADPQELKSVQEFWHQARKFNEENNANLESYKAFKRLTSSILQLAQNGVDISLDQPLSVLKKTAYPKLLYLLSFSPIGREILRASFPYLSGQAQLEDNMLVRFRLFHASESLLGEFIYFYKTDETPSKILIHPDLNIGEALSVFAHEMVHLMNNFHIQISELSMSSKESLLLDETIAFKVEQLILMDFLKYRSFQNLRESIESQSEYTPLVLSDQQIILLLVEGYGFDKGKVLEFINLFKQKLQQALKN